MEAKPPRLKVGQKFTQSSRRWNPAGVSAPAKGRHPIGGHWGWHGPFCSHTWAVWCTETHFKTHQWQSTVYRTAPGKHDRQAGGSHGSSTQRLCMLDKLQTLAGAKVLRCLQLRACRGVPAGLQGTGLATCIAEKNHSTSDCHLKTNDCAVWGEQASTAKSDGKRNATCKGEAPFPFCFVTVQQY